MRNNNFCKVNFCHKLNPPQMLRDRGERGKREKKML
jgi:hypothetical protein